MFHCHYNCISYLESILTASVMFVAVSVDSLELAGGAGVGPTTSMTGGVALRVATTMSLEVRSSVKKYQVLN